MIYGVAQQQPSAGQQRRSFRSLLYTKVIPRSQRPAANASRDNAAAHAQSAPRQDIQRPVININVFGRTPQLRELSTSTTFWGSSLEFFGKSSNNFNCSCSGKLQAFGEYSKGMGICRGRAPRKC